MSHLTRILQRLRLGMRIGITCLLLLSCIPGSQVQLLEISDRIQPFTADYQYNYLTWTLQALGEKFASASMGWQHMIPEKSYRDIVDQYTEMTGQLDQMKQQMEAYYSSPETSRNPQDFAMLQKAYAQLKNQQSLLEPVYESLLTEQIRLVLKGNQLTLGAQPIPPILFRDADLPYALILSPRDHIEQIANISLLPDLPLTSLMDLEQQLESRLPVSALVVPVGGIGTYPTMIMRTTNFSYTAEVIQHEWIHNYLTLFPLGINYETTPELRTINETTASIAGKELGTALLRRSYPDLLPPPSPPVPPTQAEKTVESQPLPPVFDFRAEMHTTRITVDALLAEGKIPEAEAYMEQRRLLFVEQGYTLRRLNQAYFAFYGAYADQPGGAAGNDPVGEAVRRLRGKYSSLAEFMGAIRWVESYEALQTLVEP